MNEEYIMRPGDTFVADECGCAFTVESGPRDENMASQAPVCCCGHRMHREGGFSGQMNQEDENAGMTANRTSGDAPRFMPG